MKHLLLFGVLFFKLTNFSLWAQSPTVTINQLVTQADPTSNPTITFVATFSESVTGFDNFDISFAGSTAGGNLTASVTSGPDIYMITVSGMTSSGTVVVSLPAGVANATYGAEPTLASTSTDNTVTYIKPSITCPGNITVSTDAGKCASIVNNIDPTFLPANALVNYTVTGTTPATGVGSASGTSFPVGVNIVTYFLPDFPGVTCSFTITVVDNEAPVVTCPINTTVNCGEDVIPPYLTTATATDNCTPDNQIEIKFLGETKTNETCFDRYILTRTWQAKDIAGNTSTCSQVITVYDTVPPRFSDPHPTPVITVASPADVPPANPDMYTAEDECGPDWEENFVPVDFAEVKSDSTCPGKFTLTRTWTATDGCGNQAVYTQVIHVKDSIAPVIDDSNLSAMLSFSCASEIPVPPTVTATDNSVGTPTVTLSEVRSDEQCANKFKLTRTWTATDACGNTSTYKQTITVDDTQAPIFSGTDPLSVTVSCEKDIPAAAVQTATDNCTSTPTISFIEVKSNIQCVNRFVMTRTWIATDECGNSSTRRQVITVYDNEAPVVSDISVDTVVLWPPNHKMREITVNYNATDNCGVTSTLSVTSNEPVHGGSDGDQAPDWEVIDEHHIRLRAEKANHGEARYYTIKINVTDGCNTPVVDSTVVTVAHNITNPHTGNPFKIGSTVSFNGVFWDKPGNTHTAKWLVDGNAAANGNVTEPAGRKNGSVTGSYKFKSAGVYKLQMNVTDQNGLTSYANTNNDLDAIVVVYDPNGGNAYGGGWYSSPAGALAADHAAEGKASYGFSVNYGNAAKPKGETQFEFKVGSFEFNALNFDYLAISGAKAQFRGTGRIIGGQSGIGFIMTVIDGALDGSGIDRIRMKIYNRNTGHVYYDNEPGASDADDPKTAIGTNSSIVIQGSGTVTQTTNNPETLINGKEVESLSVNEVDKLHVIAYPNPGSDRFTIQVSSNDLSTKIIMQVFDQQGRILEKKENITPGSAINLGENYRPGIYFVRVIQGRQHSEIKLIKLNN